MTSICYSLSQKGWKLFTYSKKLSRVMLQGKMSSMCKSTKGASLSSMGLKVIRAGQVQQCPPTTTQIERLRRDSNNHKTPQRPPTELCVWVIVQRDVQTALKKNAKDSHKTITHQKASGQVLLEYPEKYLLSFRFLNEPSSHHMLLFS